MDQIDQSLMHEALNLVKTGHIAEASQLIRGALSGVKAEAAAGNAAGSAMGAALAEAAALSARGWALPGADAPLFEAHEPAPGSHGKVLESSFVTSHGAMAYRLFVPQAGETGAPAPLIVMLHGCTQNAADFAAGTQMDKVAGERGWFVLYPQQSSRANPSSCWNWFKHTHQGRGRGEPQAMVRLIAKLAGDYPIDPSRVFVAGLSAGGAMAAILGEQYPEVFAGVAVHSGLPAGLAKDLPGALQAMAGKLPDGSPVTALKTPTIVFHGDADKTVSPLNGQRFARTMEATSDGSRSDVINAAGRSAMQTQYMSQDGKLLGEYWSVKGAGHAWSGGNNAGSYADPLGPDASEEIIRFFQELAAQGKSAA